MAGSPPESWRPPLPWWTWVLLAVSTIAVYANSLPNGFHYDDQSMIVNNPAVHDLDRLGSHFVSVAVANEEGTLSYRPLVMASYALNYAMGAANPIGYHIVNIGLHVVVSGLVLLLIWHLTAHALGAFWGGLLFALHPIQTEAVNYITARSSIMYSAGVLTAVLLFIRYRREGGAWRLGAASSAYAAALLAKEAAVVVPLLLLAYDALARRGAGLPPGWLRAHAPFWLLTGGFVFLRWALMGGVVPPAYHSDLHTVGLTFAAIVTKTLGGQLLPIDLSLSHPFGPTRQWTPAALGSVVVLVSMVTVGVLARRTAPLAALAALWFPTALLPVAALSLITTLALYQENRGYLSAVAVAMIAGPVMARWWGEGGTALVGKTGRTVQTLRRAALIGVFGLMAVAVVQRNPVWRDDLTLWSDVLVKAPMNQAAYINVGGQYQARGDLRAAAAVYQQALTRFPGNGFLHNNLGAIYLAHGDLARAAEEFQAAVRLTPGFATPHYNLGLILERTGFREDAIAAYERFLELAPGQLGTAPTISRARQRLIELRRTDPPGLN